MKRDPISVAVTLMRRSPGEVFCVSTKSPSGKWKDNFFKRRELGKIKQFVRKHKSSDVYMCPQGFSKARRDKDFAEAPHLFFADLDECNPKELPIKPTILIESSPGRYVGYWYTDGPVPEELNRRLTYFVGADSSGWDWTQVLRLPGTRNHKYDDKPLVKIIWSDGPRYQVKRLEKMIPEVETDEGKQQGGDAQAIYDDYEKHLPRRVRKELTNPQVKQGKRSEVLWWLIQELVEVGMTKDEIFTLVWDNDWNKHSERRGGERQLEREIDKAFGNHVGGSKKLQSKKDKPPSEGFFNLVTMDKVVEDDVDWIIEQMIARGQASMFEGDPGVGKSYFLMYLCIHLCDGKPLPWEDKHLKRQPMKVAYCDTENAMSAVTKARLSDNGLRNQKNYLQITEGFSLTSEDRMDDFESEVIEGWKPDIVVIDPVTLYLGGVDTHKASDVGSALDELKAMAERHGFALILVRHLNKSNSGKALYAGNGSIGFTGLARVVATVGWHPEEPNVRVVACTKNNLAPPFGSIGYSIEPLPPTMKHKYRSELIYEGRVDFTSDDIVGTVNIKEDNSVDIAADLIREQMTAGDGEVNYHSLIKQAESRSISERSVKKAAAELGLKRLTRGRGKTRKTLLIDASQKRK